MCGASGTPQPCLLSVRMEGCEEKEPPPFLPKGSDIIQTRCRMFAGRLAFICGVKSDEEVVSGRSAAPWRAFIRYCNLRLLQGRGQRWLLFTPYSTASKIIEPCSHGGRNGLGGTRCGPAMNQDCEKGGRLHVLRFFFFFEGGEIGTLMFLFDSGRSAPCDSPMLSQIPAINESVVLVRSG